MNIKDCILGTLLLVSSTVSARTSIADTLRLDEVVVTGTRNTTDIRHLPQTVTVVGRDKLTENERVSVLPTLMEQVPGLMLTSRGVLGYGVSGGGSGGMMLRGISSGAGQVMVLIDGHPQYNGIYGHSISDAYQTMMAERVEVLRGPASLLYGSNAMGGVVNIVTRSMDTDGSRAYVNLGAGSWGTFQSDAGYGMRRGKLRINASAQYSRSDNHRPNMGFEQYGGFAKVQYDLNANWRLFADADITHFNASYPGTVTAPMLEADQWITRGAVTAGIENHYKRTSGRLSLYDSFGRHKLNDGYNAMNGSPQTRLFRSNDALMGVSWYQSAVLWEGSRLTVGFDYQNIYGHAYYTSRETGEVLETQNKQSGEERNHEIAGYADIRQDIFSWLTAEAGLRYDHHTVTGSEWIPQVGIVIRPLRNGELKLMASKGFRNPTMREMYLYPPSNTDLEPEQMWSYEVSWKQRLLSRRLHYGVNLFYIDADNIIQTVNRKNVNTGALRNKGAEIELQYHINRHWSINTNHSWLDMRYPVVSAPKYKGYLGASMRYGRWSGSAGLMQVCGLYTAVGENSTTEDFTLLNATVGYAASKHARLWIKGENLLAQKYEYMAGMPMPRATFMCGVNVEF
ncbi:MAG: TonB-dependent receptor [Prevotella sp.]|nr:TonB-dependent receptor [Prevotella sp.]